MQNLATFNFFVKNFSFWQGSNVYCFGRIYGRILRPYIRPKNIRQDFSLYGIYRIYGFPTIYSVPTIYTAKCKAKSILQTLNICRQNLSVAIFSRKTDINLSNLLLADCRRLHQVLAVAQYGLILHGIWLNI